MLEEPVPKTTVLGRSVNDCILFRGFELGVHLSYPWSMGVENLTVRQDIYSFDFAGMRIVD